jgi:uncharacterized protein
MPSSRAGPPRPASPDDHASGVCDWYRNVSKEVLPASREALRLSVPHRSRGKHSDGAGVRRDITFASEGADLSGWFYSPGSVPPWPLVVMAHGFSATRRMVVDRYAEALQAAGLAVLLYDHRGFGDSGGEPRLQVNPWIQARGYRDAVSYGSALAGVDSRRIALWGDSLSGGVALASTALDGRVGGLVIQVPSLGAKPPPSDPDRSLYRTFADTILDGMVEPAPEDIEGPMPVVSDDQARRPSALPTLAAYRWFVEQGGRPGAGWVNEVTRARPKTPVPWYPSLCAPYVRCPALFVVAPDDEMPGSVPAVARDTYRMLAGPKEWVEVKYGHFGLLHIPSAEFQLASSVQARFLLEHLVGRAPGGTSPRSPPH